MKVARLTSAASICCEPWRTPGWLFTCIFFKVRGPSGNLSEAPSPDPESTPPPPVRGRGRGLTAIPNDFRIEAKSKTDQCRTQPFLVSFLQNLIFGSFPLRGIHQLKWGAWPPTSIHGFPGRKKPCGPPESGFENNLSKGWVPARVPPENTIDA